MGIVCVLVPICAEILLRFSTRLEDGAPTVRFERVEQLRKRERQDIPSLVLTLLSTRASGLPQSCARVLPAFSFRALDCLGQT